MERESAMGKLFLVSTPIGNLSDLSPRAAKTLEECDFIAAEDTRVTIKLLNYLGIKKPMVSYYEHNRAASGQRILERILSGENCALVSDAGTPIISDPGFDLVQLCDSNHIEVVSIPGPCAAICALTLSALPAGRFCFEGFLSVNKKARRAHLDSIKNESRTMIFYEAPHKLTQTLHDLSQTLGDRRVAICREITKLHEQVIRTTLFKASEYYNSNTPRGEFVLVIDGLAEAEDESYSLDEAVSMVKGLHSQGLKLKDAVRQISEKTGINKNELYKEALK